MSRSISTLIKARQDLDLVLKLFPDNHSNLETRLNILAAKECLLVAVRTEQSKLVSQEKGLVLEDVSKNFKKSQFLKSPLTITSGLLSHSGNI